MTVRWMTTSALMLAALSLMGCGGELGGGATSPVAPVHFAGTEPGLIAETEVPGGDVPADLAPAFDPIRFVNQGENLYFPLVPGTVMTYAEGDEVIRVEVTRQAKRILGVATTVVHDEVFRNGSLIEDTYDWFAVDDAGNVWYFGEDTKELDNGEVVSTEGSWEAGVDGAMPGIIMLANPQERDEYAQEVAPGVAEDRAKVVSLDETVAVAYGTYVNCLKTAESTPLEKSFHEYKYYAPGVGVVLEIAPKGGRARVELVEVIAPR